MKKVILQGIFVVLLANSSFAQVSLFGQAYGGGAHNEGEVFQLCETSGIWTYRDLYDFPAATSAANCEGQGTLFMASNKVLYGIGDYGGANWEGMIFSENPVTGTYTDLYSVADNPYLNYLMQPVPGGKLYGMGNAGGTSGDGTIFSFNYNTSAHAVLHNFTGEPGDGSSPTETTFLWYRDTLYGIAASGGNNTMTCGFGNCCTCSYGTLFSIDTNGVRYRTLYNFPPVTGANVGSEPNGNIVEAANAAGHPCIYGVCYYGGANTSKGCIWQYDLTTYTYSDIYDFKGSASSDGYGPEGGLSLASDGNLYGTTAFGGNSASVGFQTGDGTLFKISPTSHTYTLLHTFAGGNTDGITPFGTVIQASDGNLYGMAEFGGPGSSTGIAYQYIIGSSTFNDIYNFASPNVYEPVWNNFATSTSAVCDVLPISLLSFSGNYSMNTRSTDLAWATETEVNNHYFFIERSTDGINWQTIDTTAGGGNTDTPRYYTAIDHHPPVGTNYYKLVQEDFDGHQKACEVIPVFVPTPKTTTLYPNPTSSTLNIDGSNLQSIVIYNTLGQNVWTGNATDDKASVDVSSFANGVYIVQTIDKIGNTVTLRFVKESAGVIK